MAKIECQPKHIRYTLQSHNDTATDHSLKSHSVQVLWSMVPHDVSSTAQTGGAPVLDLCHLPFMVGTPCKYDMYQSHPLFLDAIQVQHDIDKSFPFMLKSLIELIKLLLIYVKCLAANEGLSACTPQGAKETVCCKNMV